MRCEYLARIFAHQQVLMEQFYEIERMNVYGRGRIPLYLDEPILLDRVDVQLRIKEEIGRIIEEVGEAFDSMSEPPPKYSEEVADAFHFLIELFLMLRVHPASFDSTEEKDPLEHAFALVYLVDGEGLSPVEAWMYFITDCTRAENLLKNRPWKRKLLSLDYGEFYVHIGHLLYSFVRACVATGITREILFNSYQQKAEVNQTRISDGV